MFIDGCFWHGCPEHGVMPKRNVDYWIPKLARNIERDRETTLLLVDAGWRVLRFWEHEDPRGVAETIIDVTTNLTSLRQPRDDGVLPFQAGGVRLGSVPWADAPMSRERAGVPRVLPLPVHPAISKPWGAQSR